MDRECVASVNGRPTTVERFRRLVVVSHRLPFVVHVGPERTRVRRTVGGLVRGIEGFLASAGEDGKPRPTVWVGWAGDFPGEEARGSVRRAAAESDAHPVFLDGDVHARFYEGFANRALWPLFHSFPSYVDLAEADWDAYRLANEAFRDAVLDVVREGDAVWVHDYQLMLLPALLRAAAPDLPVAYFHHVPFPPFDILRVLPDPWARALVAGVLGADVAGFQTYDDVRVVLRAASRLLGLDPSGDGVTVAGRAVRVEAFPIGVDFPRWDAAARNRTAASETEALLGPLGDRRVVLSVDRMDYTKGILNRLLAFERFLERRPEWRGRVTLVVVAVPSRQGVDAYRRLRVLVDEAVGRVNGRYGTFSWTPVLYQFRSLEFQALAALYRRADVAFVTPLRDGMNLVAKEFLASREDEDGVLVLSDTTGAARELGEAVLVNPFHVDGLAEAIATALVMPADERRRRCRHMRARLARYDVRRWGAEQLRTLTEARLQTQVLRARQLPPAERSRLVAAWTSARHRLLLLDYDGTLVDFTGDPDAAAPDAALRRLLSGLAEQEGTRLVIVSGRDSGTLDAWFPDRAIGLVAEHGARIRDPLGAWAAGAGLPSHARARILALMQVFADRLPGAFVEEKTSSVAWHWRAADPEVGAVRAREIVEAISAHGIGREAHVLVGKKVVEARAVDARKGLAVRRFLAERPWDFVMAAGDDATDEELFASLPADAWSLRVGPGESGARFNVDRPADLRALLGDLAGIARTVV